MLMERLRNNMAVIMIDTAEEAIQYDDSSTMAIYRSSLYSHTQRFYLPVFYQSSVGKALIATVKC